LLSELSRGAARRGLLGGKLDAGAKGGNGVREVRYIFLSMTRLNEAFVRREYELCDIQVTRNIGRRLWAGRFNLSLAVEDGEYVE